MELVLPQNYVEIEEEEMMYLDGGITLSRRDARNALIGLGMAPGTPMAVAITAAVIIRVTRWAKAKGGIFGFLAGAAVLIATRAVSRILLGLGDGAIRNGVQFGWSISPLNGFVLVNVRR